MKKKIILGNSDAWNIRRWVDESHRPSEPAYYIVDCRILSLSISGDAHHKQLRIMSSLKTLK